MKFRGYINSEQAMFFTGGLSLIVAILGSRFLTNGHYEKFISQYAIVESFLQILWIVLLIVSIVCNLRGVTLRQQRKSIEGKS